MNKKTKIAIVTYTLQNGGLERVVSNQTLMFKTLGYEVDLIVLQNEIDFPYKGKLHVFDLNINDSFLVKIYKYFKVRKVIQNGNFDFILDHRYRLNNFMEFFWLNFIYKSKPLLYFIHSGDIRSYVNDKLIKASNIRFVSVSEGITNKLKSTYHNIKVTTIYNNIEISKVESNFTEIHENYILAAGRMDEFNVKQFDVLINCYANSELPKKGIKLLILGSGIGMEILKKQVQSLNLHNFVIFKGWVTDLYSYYKNAQFLVLCSKFEGLGMVLIESLLCGTPVISYDCEFGPNEIIENKKNGLLVENQNSIELIKAMNLFVNDLELYNFCKANAKDSVRKFTKKSISEKWKVFFNDIL